MTLGDPLVEHTGVIDVLLLSVIPRIVGIRIEVPRGEGGDNDRGDCDRDKRVA